MGLLTRVASRVELGCETSLPVSVNVASRAPRDAEHGRFGFASGAEIRTINFSVWRDNQSDL